MSYDYLLSQSSGGDPNDILEFGPMKIRRHLVQTIVKAAQAVQTDPVLLMAVADKESSFITAVQAKTSSATGLYQFIERTWLGVVRDFGAQVRLAKEAALVTADANDKPVITDAAERARVLELRRDPYLSALMAGEMLKRDAARISQRIGRELTLGEVYLAHFLGPDDAGDFLDKVVNKPAPPPPCCSPAGAGQPLDLLRGQPLHRTRPPPQADEPLRGAGPREVRGDDADPRHALSECPRALRHHGLRRHGFRRRDSVKLSRAAHFRCDNRNRAWITDFSPR